MGTGSQWPISVKWMSKLGHSAWSLLMNTAISSSDASSPAKMPCTTMLTRLASCLALGAMYNHMNHFWLSTLKGGSLGFISLCWGSTAGAGFSLGRRIWGFLAWFFLMMCCFVFWMTLLQHMSHWTAVGTLANFICSSSLFHGEAGTA
jgi:hypothetical protein